MDTIFANLVQKVLAFYPLQVSNIYLLSYKGKKAVWSIRAQQDEYILKKVPFDQEHIRFMTHAIDYLKANGVHTPGVIKTSSGDGHVEIDGEYFVMFECVHGRSPEYEHEGELSMIMQGMATFHRASRGIESPTGSFPSFLLEEWKEDYQRRHDQLLAWKELREAATETKQFDRLFLQHAEHFLGQCQQALELLSRSGFDSWAKEIRTTKSLCHQDYAAGNLLIGQDGKLYVYDMDSLTVDLPVRDLRKILNKVMKKESQWDLTRMRAMLEAYQSVNPLTKPQLLVLAADIQFPHLFFGQVSKYYNHREEKWPIQKHVSRLKDMIATELSKEAVLRAFLVELNEVI
jgi:CotS family spore coat protein